MMAAASGDALPKPKQKKKAQAKTPFKVPYKLSRPAPPEPPWDCGDYTYRCEEHAPRQGAIPEKLRQAANAGGLVNRPELPDMFKHAVHKSGKPHARRVMREATQDLVKKGVRFGSGGFDPEEEPEEDEETKAKKALKVRLYTDQELRQAFTCFDLNGNDYIDAAELRHIFAQIGEMPSDNEISAMILLCDPRGEGTVNFDDFLNVFANPADSLRNVNVKGIKHLLPRKKIEFDIRDPLGIVLEEKVKLKEISVFVTDIRKGSQSHDAGVKAGWKVISLEAIPVTSIEDFETRLAKCEKAGRPEDEEELGVTKPKKKGSGKGRKLPEKPEDKDPKLAAKKIKWDYSIVFELLPGMGDSSSEESLQEEEEEEFALEDEEEDEEDND